MLPVFCSVIYALGNLVEIVSANQLFGSLTTNTITVDNWRQQQGCARFPEFTQNFSERQILWSLCSVDFHTLTLQLPIQTPHSVAPELQVFVSSLENCPNFSKTSTTQGRIQDFS